MSATANVSMVTTRSRKGASKTAAATAEKATTKSRGANVSSTSSSSSSRLGNVLAIAAGVIGVYSSYLTQGVLQERLATQLYAGKRFNGLDALHGAQALACAFFALVLLVVVPGLRPNEDDKGKRKPTSSVAPPVAYWRAGLSNSVGPTLGYLALKNISYPAQVLAKSCKMIPVMLMGTLLSGKRYSAFEYSCAAAIAGGVALFAGAGRGASAGAHAAAAAKAATKRLAAPNAPLGYTLCLLNLLLDGYTNAAQDELHSRFDKTPPLWTMAWMNAWCAAYNCAYLFLGPSGAGKRLLSSLASSAAARSDVALFCACGAVGQLFIFYTIARFGSLTNTLITTTRKFFNILLSVLWLGTPLDATQWAAVALVFSGLGASGVAKSRGKGGKTKSH